MKAKNLAALVLTKGDETSPVRGSLMRSIPALMILAAALIVSGCQQVPTDHWSPKRCQSKANDAKNCYPTDLPHLPVHK